MAKNLVIVESPAKCRTITKYLGSDFVVKATMGHIIDLPEKELGVDLEHDFKPKYITSKGKRKVIAQLKEEATKAETVFLAPDPDREGEAIAWHVAESISKVNTNVKRVFFNEITKKAVLAAFEHPSDIDMNKVNAQQARRILDRIVGYQVSPILWRTVFRGLSAGRVQSVALRIICEREDDIKAFKTEEYWSIEAIFGHKGLTFGAQLFTIDGQKISLGSKDATDAIIARVTDKKCTVKDVQKTEKERKPYAPFITSTMQQESVKKLGFSAAKTMMIAQQLYEGLELGDLGSTGLITYMRTDSTRIADEALTGVRKLITEMYDAKHIADKPRVYSKSKSAQDAHEAIRPAQIDAGLAPAKIKKYLTIDQFKLYDLIWKRFLASQMANAVFDQTRIDIDVDGCTFRATGSIMKFDGFLALYDESADDTKIAAPDSEEDHTLPDIAVATPVDMQSVSGTQHFTQPPPRYSEASLVRELEEKSIGRPSTYAQIIDTLKTRKYVTVENKRFMPTEVGIMVKDIIVKKFPDIFQVGFTAGMEEALDKIEVGDADWIKTLHNFYTPFEKELTEAKADIQNMRSQNQQITDRICPVCNKFPLVVKWSRNGKFLACQGFPACRHTEPLEKPKTTLTNEVCEKCGAPMVVLEMKNNRFLGCSRYPECKSTRSLPTGVMCPNPDCKGTIIERKTRRGKIFFGCSAYPKCDFATWDRPVNQKCESCGFPMLVEKANKRKGQYLFCTKCKTEFPIAAPVDVVPEEGAVVAPE